jgi:hypothetical protein
MMTLKQFTEARTRSEDLGVIVPEFEVRGQPPAKGFVYPGWLVIEEVSAHWPESTKAQGRFYLLLGNWERVTDDLESLERDLYQYAGQEGIL